LSYKVVSSARNALPYFLPLIKPTLIERVDVKTQKGITQKALFGLAGITPKGKTQKGQTLKIC
jgi:hypothetical protein